MVNFGPIPFNLRVYIYSHYQFLKEVNMEIRRMNGKGVQHDIFIGEMCHSDISWAMYRKKIDDYETWNRSNSLYDLYKLGELKRHKIYKRYLDTFNWDYCGDIVEYMEMAQRWNIIL
tara:strand:- start:126 stop:476 length:351 start_codon:yes stop_codon:yes gene_type:complete